MSKMSDIEFQIDAALDELKNESEVERKVEKASKGRSGNMNMILLAGLLFVLLSSPMAYGLTAPLAAKAGLELVSNDTPNMVGVVAHGVVFVIVLYFASKMF